MTPSLICKLRRHRRSEAVSGTLQKILPQFVRSTENRRSLQGDGSAAEPFGAGWRQVRVAPDDADMVARRESQHLGHNGRETGIVIGAAVGQGRSS